MFFSYSTIKRFNKIFTMQSKHSVHIPSFHNIWVNMSLTKTYKTTFQYRPYT